MDVRALLPARVTVCTADPEHTCSSDASVLLITRIACRYGSIKCAGASSQHSLQASSGAGVSRPTLAVRGAATPSRRTWSRVSVSTS